MLYAACCIEQQFTDVKHTSTGLCMGASTTISICLLPQLLTLPNTQTVQRDPRFSTANSAAIATAVAHFAVDLGLIEGPCHEPVVLKDP